MKSANQKILVRVNLDQKNFMQIGESLVKMAQDFATNYREKSPVLGVFAESNKLFTEGQVAIFHHNHFYRPSPYHLYDDLYSVPMNKTIFGVLNSDGEFVPVMGNMTCERIAVETSLPLPPDQVEYHNSQYKILDPGWTTYKKGDVVLTRPSSGYEIVYHLDNIERKVIKVDQDMVCGIVKNSQTIKDYPKKR